MSCSKGQSQEYAFIKLHCTYGLQVQSIGVPCVRQCYTNLTRYSLKAVIVGHRAFLLVASLM